MVQSESIINQLSLVYSEKDLARIQIQHLLNGELNITIDVHEMSRFEARRFINNTIGIVHADFQLTVIHGYNHGTAIRDMLKSQFDNRHIRDRQLDPFNPGRTILSIA